MLILLFSAEFNLARGHDIERKNYLDELKKYEKNPLKFESGSYSKHGEHPCHRVKPIKPLMDVLPPLVPHFRMQSAREADIIQPLMELPPPLIQPEYQYTYDPRPRANFDVHSQFARPSYIASCRNDSREMNRRYKKRDKRRP